MSEFYPIIISGVVGVLSGFIVSIPVGPINITIINEGARRGFQRAFLIGMGAVFMEVIYCALGFAGFATFFDSKLLKAIMELVSFVLMMFLGFKYLLAQTVETTSKSATVVEEKLHPHNAFTIGFVRVLGNPAVLLMWITLAGAFSAHDWVDDNWVSRSACIGGVGAGASAWFLLLSYFVGLKHKNFSTKILLRMSHVSGIILLAAALGIGIRIILLLEKILSARQH